MTRQRKKTAPLPPNASETLKAVEDARDKLIHQLRKERERTRALVDVTKAALAMLRLGDEQSAGVILNTVPHIGIDSYREEVSHGPGGVYYVSAKEKTS